MGGTSWASPATDRVPCSELASSEWLAPRNAELGTGIAMPLGLGTALKAAVLAALLAALIAAAFHELVSEPLIEQAIQLEAARQPGQPEEEVVSRPVQRAGLVLALALYGVTWALALGGVFALAQE